MGIKQSVKRALKYIIKGVPDTIVTVNVAQLHYGGALKGKRILITGGTRGLGFAIAKRSIEEQAIVTITGRSIERINEAVRLLGSPKGLFGLEHDVVDIDSNERIVSKAAELMGGVDILVNNAGVSVHDIDYSTCSEAQWDLQMNTNLKGVYFMTQAFMRYYEASISQQGKIIIMTSERGLYGDDVPYGLAKRALISYTEGLATKLIKKGVRVNAIAPGVTATEMTGYSVEGNLYRERARGQRVLLPEEIAETAVFLMSDASNCISGQVIACNEANHLK